MKESYDRRVSDPRRPRVMRGSPRGRDEALTGVRAGRVLSRERNSLRGADAVGEGGRQHPERRQREAFRDPARSKTPSTCGNTSRGNREIPSSPVTDGVTGRVGKSKDARR